MIYIEGDRFFGDTFEELYVFMADTASSCCTKNRRMHKVSLKCWHLSSKLLDVIRITCFTELCRIGFWFPNGITFLTASPFQLIKISLHNGDGRRVIVPRFRSRQQWNYGNEQWSIPTSSSCHLCVIVALALLLLLSFRFLCIYCCILRAAYFNLRKRAMMTRLWMPTHSTPNTQNNQQCHCVRVEKSKLIFPFATKTAQCGEEWHLKRVREWKRWARHMVIHSVDHRSISRNVAQTFRSLIKRNQILFHSTEQHRMAIK